MNQWELKANTRDQRQARENACDQVAIGFGFASDWLSRWREFFKPITERSKAKPKQFSDYFRHSIENRSIAVKAWLSTANGKLQLAGDFVIFFSNLKINPSEKWKQIHMFTSNAKLPTFMSKLQMADGKSEIFYHSRKKQNTIWCF